MLVPLQEVAHGRAVSLAKNEVGQSLDLRFPRLALAHEAVNEVGGDGGEELPEVVQVFGAGASVDSFMNHAGVLPSSARAPARRRSVPRSGR